MVNTQTFKSRSLLMAGAALWLPLMMSQASFAQEVPTDTASDSPRLDEIIVTANKRAEDQQDVPIAVTTLGEEELLSSQFVDNVGFATRVPGLEIRNVGIPVSNIFVRGIGSNDSNLNASQAVGTIEDGLFIQNAITSNVLVYDLASIEVLKGPQGTLFGKNTSGGAIVYNSQTPKDEFGGYAQVSYGRFDEVRAEGAINVPLIDDVLAVRVAAISITRDGTRDNLISGEDVIELDEFGIRGTVRFTPNQSTDALLKVSFRDRDTDFPEPDFRGLIDPATFAPQFAAFENGDRPEFIPGFTNIAGFENPDTDPLTTTTNLASFLRQQDLIISLDIDQDIGENLTLTSVTGYLENDSTNAQDVDGGPLDLVAVSRDTEIEQFSQELRLASNFDGPFNFVVGGFYLAETIDNTDNTDLFRAFIGSGTPFEPFAAFINRNFVQETDSFAIFGQAEYNVTSRLKATLGLRFTHEERSLVQENLLTDNGSVLDPVVGNTLFEIIPLTNLEEDFSEVSGKASLDYALTDDTLVYGSVSRGFRAGGFAGGAIQSAAELSTFDPEIVWAYELGLKTEFWNGRGRLNTTAFIYDFSDLQVFSFGAVGSTDTGGVDVLQIIDNASDAFIYGGEIELTLALTDALTVNAGLGLLDSEYRNFVDATGVDFSGNDLISAPNFDLNAGAVYTFPVRQSDEIELRGNVSYTSERFFDPSNLDRLSGEAFTFVDLSASYFFSDRSIEIRAWVKNLTDEVAVQDAIDLSGAIGADLLFFNDPRTFGVTVGYRF